MKILKTDSNGWHKLAFRKDLVLYINGLVLTVTIAWHPALNSHKLSQAEITLQARQDTHAYTIPSVGVGLCHTNPHLAVFQDACSWNLHKAGATPVGGIVKGLVSGKGGSGKE